MSTATWDSVAGDRRLAVGVAHLPGIAAALDDVRDVARRTVPAELLDPCRALAASLLSGTSPVPVPLDSPAGLTACLAFTEHFVLDVASMPDAVADRLVDALGPQGATDFTQALLVEEQRIRLALAFERLGIGAQL